MFPATVCGRLKNLPTAGLFLVMFSAITLLFFRSLEHRGLYAAHNLRQEQRSGLEYPPYSSRCHMMNLTASEVSAIQSTIDCWERAEYWCIGLVALGVFGKEIGEFTEWFGKHKRRLEKCSAILLVAALILEGVCTERANKFSGLLIGSLNETARGFESQIADANLQAENERLARVKLEKSLNWRRVSAKQKESIKRAL